LHHLHHEGDNLTSSQHVLLFLDDDFDAAIPRPAFRIVSTVGIRIGCDRTLFPIPVCRHALAPQVIHNEFVRYGFGAGERQRTVGVKLTDRVGVPFNDEIPPLCTRVVKNRGYRVNRFARFGVEVCAAEAKKHVRESDDNTSVRFLDVKLLFT
jgi:hypothetical protein